MFECLSPGSWVSDDSRLALVHMMAGTAHEQWELYLTKLGDAKIDAEDLPVDLDDTDFLCSQFICGSIDFGGHALAEDVKRLAEQRG
jgi:hypothetical protein